MNLYSFIYIIYVSTYIIMKTVQVNNDLLVLRRKNYSRLIKTTECKKMFMYAFHVDQNKYKNKKKCNNLYSVLLIKCYITLT